MWGQLSCAGRVILVGAIALVAINIIQFRETEVRAWIYFSALHHRDSGNVLHAAWLEDPNSSSRFSAFFALSYLSPDSTYLIADSSSASEDDYFVERLYAFGSPSAVTRVTGDAVAEIGDLDVEQYTVASGAGGFRGAPWAIVLEGGDDEDYHLPTGYLGQAFEGKDVISVDPQTYLVVRWPVSTSINDWGYRWLFVDTDLLPSRVREQ
jgi:hypothetical protein